MNFLWPWGSFKTDGKHLIVNKIYCPYISQKTIRSGQLLVKKKKKPNKRKQNKKPLYIKIFYSVGDMSNEIPKSEERLDITPNFVCAGNIYSYVIAYF